MNTNKWKNSKIIWLEINGQKYIIRFYVHFNNIQVKLYTKRILYTLVFVLTISYEILYSILENTEVQQFYLAN